MNVCEVKKVKPLEILGKSQRIEVRRVYLSRIQDQLRHTFKIISYQTQGGEVVQIAIISMERSRDKFVSYIRREALITGCLVDFVITELVQSDDESTRGRQEEPRWTQYNIVFIDDCRICEVADGLKPKSTHYN